MVQVWVEEKGGIKSVYTVYTGPWPRTREGEGEM